MAHQRARSVEDFEFVETGGSVVVRIGCRTHAVIVAVAVQHSVGHVCLLPVMSLEPAGRQCGRSGLV